MNLYCRDPKTQEPSVSLTILWLSVIYLITMGVLTALGKINETNVAMEFFGMSAGLYFGRRFNINKGSVEVQPTSNEENK